MRRLFPRSLAVLLLAVPLFVGCAAGEPEAEDVPTVIGAPQYSTTSAQARAAILRAEDRFDLGDNRGAYRHALDAISIDPLWGYAYLLANWTAPTFEDRRAHLRRAIENSSGASDEERLLIEATQRDFDGDREGALTTLRQLIALDESNPRGHLNYGWAMFERNRDEEARAAFRRAIELAPDFASAHWSLAFNLVTEAPTDFAAAEPHVQRLLELKPSEPGSYDMLGDLRRGQGRLAEARDAYTRQAELDTTRALPYGQRGHTNTFLGDYAAARSDFARARDKGEDNEPSFYTRYLAYTYVFEGRSDVAMDSLQSLLANIDGMQLASRDDERANTLIDVIVLAGHRGDAATARAAGDQVWPIWRARAEATGTPEARAQTESDVAFWQGWIEFVAGNDAAALEKAREAMRLVADLRDPRKNESAHAIMGWVALRQGRADEAVAHFEQSNMDQPYVEYHYAKALEAAGRMEDAMRVYREVADFRFNSLTVAIVKPLAQARIAQAGAARGG